MSSSRIPEATVARLPVYLRALNAMIEAGTATCSSLELATATERFEEGRERAPRVLPDRPESFALGDVRRDPAMYTVGEIDAAG